MNLKKKQQKQYLQASKYNLHTEEGVLSWEQELQAKCVAGGFRFVANVLGEKSPWARHWMVDTDNGVRLLDYWPGTQHWYSPETGLRGDALPPAGLMAKAVELRHRHYTGC